MPSNPFTGIALDTSNRGRWFLSILQRYLGTLPATVGADTTPLFVFPSMTHASRASSFPYVYVELLDENVSYNTVSGITRKDSSQEFFVGLGVQAGSTLVTLGDNLLSDMLDLVEGLFGSIPIEASVPAQRFTPANGGAYTVAVSRTRFPEQIRRGYLPPEQGARLEMRVTGKMFYNQTPF